MHCFHQRKRPRHTFLVLQNLAKMASTSIHVCFIFLSDFTTVILFIIYSFYFREFWKVSDFTYILKLTQIKCSKYLTQFLQYLQTECNICIKDKLFTPNLQGIDMAYSGCTYAWNIHGQVHRVIQISNKNISNDVRLLDELRRSICYTRRKNRRVCCRGLH